MNNPLGTPARSQHPVSSPPSVIPYRPAARRLRPRAARQLHGDPHTPPAWASRPRNLRRQQWMRTRALLSVSTPAHVSVARGRCSWRGAWAVDSVGTGFKLFKHYFPGCGGYKNAARALPGGRGSAARGAAAVPSLPSHHLSAHD